MKKENRVVVYVGRGCPAEQAVTPLINQKGKEITYCWAKSNLYKQPHGFTLIELLVVVLIIGILAAVAVPQYQKAVYKSRYAMLKDLTVSLAKAETAYYLANDAYTENLAQLDIELSGGQLDESTPKKYVWNWGYCMAFLATDVTNKINVHCINEEINMGYVLTLTPTQTRGSCYVYGSVDPKDFPLQSKICQIETGLSKMTGGNSNTQVGDYVRWQY